MADLRKLEDLEACQLAIEQWLEHRLGLQVPFSSLRDGFILLQTMALLPGLQSKIDLSFYATEEYLSLDLESSELLVWENVYKYAIDCKLLVSTDASLSQRRSSLSEEQCSDLDSRALNLCLNEVRQGNVLSTLNVYTALLKLDIRYCHEYPEVLGVLLEHGTDDVLTGPVGGHANSPTHGFEADTRAKETVSLNAQSKQSNSLNEYASTLKLEAVDAEAVLSETGRLRTIHGLQKASLGPSPDLEGALALWINAVLEVSGSECEKLSAEDVLFFQVKPIANKFIEALFQAYPLESFFNVQRASPSGDRARKLGSFLYAYARWAADKSEEAHRVPPSPLDPQSPFDGWLDSTDAFVSRLETESRTLLLTFFLALFKGLYEISRGLVPSSILATAYDGTLPKTDKLASTFKVKTSGEPKKAKIRISKKKLCEVAAPNVSSVDSLTLATGEDTLDSPLGVGNLERAVEQTPSFHTEICVVDPDVNQSDCLGGGGLVSKVMEKEIGDLYLPSLSPCSKSESAAVSAYPKLGLLYEASKESNVCDPSPRASSKILRDADGDLPNYAPLSKAELGAFSLNLSQLDKEDPSAHSMPEIGAGAAENFAHIDRATSFSESSLSVEHNVECRQEASGEEIGDTRLLGDDQGTNLNKLIDSVSQVSLFSAKDMPRVRTPWLPANLYPLESSGYSSDDDSASVDDLQYLDRLVLKEDHDYEDERLAVQVTDALDSSGELRTLSEQTSCRSSPPIREPLGRPPTAINAGAHIQTGGETQPVRKCATAEPNASLNMHAINSSSSLRLDSFERPMDMIANEATPQNFVREEYVFDSEVYDSPQLANHSSESEADRGSSVSEPPNISRNVLSYSLAKNLRDAKDYTVSKDDSNARENYKTKGKTDSAVEFVESKCHAEAEVLEPVELKSAHPSSTAFLVSDSGSITANEWDVQEEKLKRRKVEFLAKLDLKRKQVVKGNDCSVQAADDSTDSCSPAKSSRARTLEIAKGNKKIIRNAILSIIREGVNDVLRKQVLDCLDSAPNQAQYAILLRDSKNLTFKGLYVLESSCDEPLTTDFVQQLRKIFHGKVSQGCPMTVSVSALDAFYKYDTGSKSFKAVPTKTLSTTIHAVALASKYSPTKARSGGF